MTETATTATPEATIDRDVSCPACGYNLRGLSEDGRCPECAAPVGRALHGPLGGASDRIVRQLDLGLRLGFGLLLLNLTQWLPEYADDIVADMLRVGLSAAVVIAACLVSAPQLQSRGSGADRRRATALRVAAIALAAGVAFTFAAVQFGASQTVIRGTFMLGAASVVAIDVLYFRQLAAVATMAGVQGSMRPFRLGAIALAIGPLRVVIKFVPGGMALAFPPRELGWIFPWVAVIAALVLATAMGALRHAIRSARSPAAADPPGSA